MNKVLFRGSICVLAIIGILVVIAGFISTDTKKQKSVTAPITVVPGSTINTIARSLSRAGLRSQEFLRLTLPTFGTSSTSTLIKSDDRPAGSGLEGYLYPDTYEFASYQTGADMARIMISNFNRHFPYDLWAHQKGTVRSLHEVVTMASVLEKEVMTKEDKNIVAGILWKRLDQHMPLQIDSTTQYFLTPPEGVTYNTYEHAGLPFGPISNPSDVSLQAALQPTATDYWYFLNTREGKIVYSKTLGEHLINKAKYVQ